MDVRRAEVAATTDRLVGVGATGHGHVEELGSYWMVRQDPEGNEFCVTWTGPAGSSTPSSALTLV